MPLSQTLQFKLLTAMFFEWSTQFLQTNTSVWVSLNASNMHECSFHKDLIFFCQWIRCFFCHFVNMSKLSTFDMWWRFLPHSNTNSITLSVFQPICLKLIQLVLNALQCRMYKMYMNKKSEFLYNCNPNQQLINKYYFAIAFIFWKLSKLNWKYGI